MGNYLSEPKRQKESESSQYGRLKWGSSSMQGWRVDMEDAHITVGDLGGPSLKGKLSLIKL
jgi:protein phosphatase 1G